MGNRQRDTPISDDGLAFFQLSGRLIDGQVFNFGLMQGKAKLFLIVNIACKAPNARAKLSQLSRLHDLYEDRGLQVLAFPSNSFRNEFATDQEISSFLAINFKLRFLVFEKAEVDGSDPHPVYAFLRRNGPLYDGGTGLCASLPGDYSVFVVDGTGRVAFMAKPSFSLRSMQEWVLRMMDSMQ